MEDNVKRLVLNPGDMLELTFGPISGRFVLKDVDFRSTFSPVCESGYFAMEDICGLDLTAKFRSCGPITFQDDKPKFQVEIHDKPE